IEILSTLRNASGQLISGWTETQGSSNQDYSMTSSLVYDWYRGQTKTLYPIWVTPVTLTFDANGGEGDVPSPIETYYQGQFDIPAVSLTKEGYVFAGWAWESNATYSVYENGSTNNGYYESDGKSTLYAVWAVPRTITFDSNGGDGEVPASISTYYEGRFEVPSANLTKAGYTFLGWSFTKNLTSTYGGGDIYESGDTRGYGYNADKTLYAVWGAPVTITFDMNDGTGTSLGTATASFGESFNFPTKPTRAGYEFRGWDYKQNAEYPNWGTSTTSDTSRFISGNATIYAQWEVLSNQVYVGSLTSSELAAIQEVWSGKSSLSQISDRTLIQSMYDNNIHSRFGVNVYLNDVKLGLNRTSNSSYGFNYDTNYAKLSTNTYVFEFENALPTGWKLVNYRYEVQAQGDVTIVDGKARATVNYSYIESFADPSDNLFLMFVLPSMPAESTSVGINISAAPGNVIDKLVTGDSSFEWNYFLQTGFLIEIYDGENNLLWLGNPSSSNEGKVSYRFATGTYKLRIYTTNVVGFRIYSAADASLITGQDVSSVTHGDNYSEVTFNYTFADGNPDMILLFSMADVSDLTKLERMDVSSDFCGPYNIVGNWFKGMVSAMGLAYTDMSDADKNYAGYCGMLMQEYFNGSICKIPSFGIYTENGKIIENSENLVLELGVECTIKFAEEVKEVMLLGNDSMSVNSITNITYNEATGTWDATFSVSESTMLMFLTADLDLSQYEDLPAYDAATDYSEYLQGS
ncbi:MAG: InlB B-repeat-containing protein, partial [Firmicutes bacterium]|nr:InlB B-repeat-containing protein [Bacillota bacterium]